MIQVGITTFTDTNGKKRTITRGLLERLRLDHTVGAKKTPREKITSFLWAKRFYFESLRCPVRYVELGDFQEVTYQWSDEDCEKVWRELVRRTQANNDYSDGGVCPWCVLHRKESAFPNCYVCLYGVRRGYCSESAGPYQMIKNYFNDEGLNLPLMRDYIILLDLITVESYGEEKDETK